MSTVTLTVRLARRLPDPLSNSTHGTERHIFFVPVRALPTNIPTGPVPRAVRRWDVYKQVQASLLDQNCTPGTFHLKNQGITIVARAVEKMEENEYAIHLGEGQGVIDGAQTYAVIRETKRDKAVQLPKQQFVRVEVITKLPDGWTGEVAAALNASMQTSADTLRHLSDALGWLRDELASRPYFASIAWSEEERGVVDVKDILCILTCFETAAYSNNAANHPVVAYEKRNVVISSFEQDFKATGGQAYRRLRPIVREILMLHDIVQAEYPTFQRRAGLPGDGLVESSSDKGFDFPFIGRQGSERLARGPLYAILASFRWLVEADPAADTVRWRGGFENVLQRWRELAPRYVQLSTERLAECGGSADLLGKSASHWGMLHREVALAELMSGDAPVAADPTNQRQPPVDSAAAGAAGDPAASPTSSAPAGAGAGPLPESSVAARPARSAAVPRAVPAGPAEAAGVALPVEEVDE